MAAPLQRELIRGDTRRVNISVVDSRGEPVDITGATVFFTLSSSNNPQDNGNAAIPPKIADLSNPTTGRASILLSSDDTTLEPGVYYFDAQVIDTWGDTFSRKQASLTVLADITR